MKRSKVVAAVAVLLTVIGCAMMIYAYCSEGDGNLYFLNTEKVEFNTDEVDSDFDSIKIINDGFIPFKITHTQSDKCTVEYPVINSAELFQIEVENKTLKIVSKKAPKSTLDNFGIYVENQKPRECVINLPKATYKRLEASLSGADIISESELSFNEVQLNSTDGEIKFDSQAKNLKVTSSSGNVILKLNADEAEVSSYSGEIEITGKANTLKASSQDGIKLDNTTAVHGEISSAYGDISLTDSFIDFLNIHGHDGDVKLERCDGKEIEIDTDSGSIYGLLLTGKTFEVKSSGGSVDVPKNADTGKCGLATSGGDIKIEITQ